MEEGVEAPRAKFRDSRAPGLKEIARFARV
jgi:hypothetical protein